MKKIKFLKQTFSVLIFYCIISLIISCGTDDEPYILPEVTTVKPTSIKATTAKSGGNIASQGSSPITAFGVCWSTDSSPSLSNKLGSTNDGSGIGNFSSILGELIPETFYYIKAYATNSSGTAYGNAESFKTGGMITDIEGNVYNTIEIGNQTWMAENLKTATYNDGTTIPLITNDNQWINLTTPGYCWYNNDAGTNKNTYGAIYNFYTINTGKLCPSGWHVPTDGEWTILSDYLGGDSIAGGKLKEAGTTHWTYPNTGATNESNFWALPGGVRVAWDGLFYARYEFAGWWTASEMSSNHAYGRFLNYDEVAVSKNEWVSKAYGYSVRCIKD